MSSIANFAALKVLQEHDELLRDLGQKIWKNPELAYNEVYAHDLLAHTLESMGFSVRRHYILPTSFRAEFSTLKTTVGPTIAVLCEYDCLTGIGHACGHNLIAELGVAAGVAIKAALESDESFSGKVVVLGTPAEEGGGGKIQLIDGGAFDDIDVALMAHPDVVTKMYPLILALSRVTVTYTSMEKLSSHHHWKESNASDAAVACYSNVVLLKQHLSRNCRLSGIIKQGGVDPGIVPVKTELHFHLRAPSRGELKMLKKKVESCFISAATATGCQVAYQYDSYKDYEGMISNRTIAKLYQKYAKSFGLRFEDGDPGTFPLAVSTDMGNLSHVVPSIHPCYSIGQGSVNHSPGFTVLAGAPEAHAPTLTVAKALALTAIEIMRHPDILKDIKNEFYDDMCRDETVC